MSTFQRRYSVKIDGQEHELTSRPADFLAAERALARDKVANATETAPLQLQMRIVFFMWGRSFPDDPAARDWPKFLEVLDDVTDLDAEQGEPLTPTQPVDTEN